MAGDTATGPRGQVSSQTAWSKPRTLLSVVFSIDLRTHYLQFGCWGLQDFSQCGPWLVSDHINNQLFGPYKGEKEERHCQTAVLMHISQFSSDCRSKNEALKKIPQNKTFWWEPQIYSAAPESLWLLGPRNPGFACLTSEDSTVTNCARSVRHPLSESFNSFRQRWFFDG